MHNIIKLENCHDFNGQFIFISYKIVGLLAESDRAPPTLLYYIMGAWAVLTGVTGFLANAIAIILFSSAKQVHTLSLSLSQIFFFF